MSKQVTIDGNAMVAAPTKLKDKHLDMLMWAVTGPIIVYPGGWGNDVPEDILSQIKIDRLVTVMSYSNNPNSTVLAPEVEAMWYISSASLEHPLDRDLVDIYTYLTKNWWLKTKKEELPDFLSIPELNDYQKGILTRLREFIFNRSIKEVKNSLKTQKKTEPLTTLQTDLLQI